MRSNRARRSHWAKYGTANDLFPHGSFPGDGSGKSSRGKILATYAQGAFEVGANTGHTPNGRCSWRAGHGLRNDVGLVAVLYEARRRN